MAAKKSTDKGRDLHAEVTANIIKAIEAGASGSDWSPPWVSLTSEGLPENAVTHKQYRGVNILNLWASAMGHGYTAPLWATYKQWASVGASVRKRPDDVPPGDWGTRIVFYKQLRIDDPDSDNGDKLTIPLLRYSTVFNADQVDGWDGMPERPEPPNIAERVPELDGFIEGTGAEIRTNGGRAYYNLSEDYVGMPERELFTSTEGYYSTAFHELTHWSGHRSRLDRKLSTRFGDDQYAAEELVAELGAAFLCASLKIEAEPREDHAQYVAHWLRLLRKDDKAIFTAAARA